MTHTFESRVISHFTQLIRHGTDRYGDIQTPMWVSSLDLNTLQYPADVNPSAGHRVYREIAGPRGSVIYWDMKQLWLAQRVAGRSGDPAIAEAADAYVRHYLSIAAGDGGLWAFGNHYYYDLFEDRFKVFGYSGACRDDNPADRTHVEHRPLLTEWEVFWRIDPAATERHLRSFVDRSVEGGLAGTGGHFDRHTSRLTCGTNFSFAEAGGAIVYAATWLAEKLGGDQPDLLNAARRVARFTFNSRDPVTGLIPVQNSTDRWDRAHATTEIGLWSWMLHVAALNFEPGVDMNELLTMSIDALRPYVERGWDERTGQYFGKLNIRTGLPDLSIGDNRPGPWADPWNSYFPDHDYALPFARACLSAYTDTREDLFADAVRRMAGWIMRTRPGRYARAGRGAYAGNYALAINFLGSAGSWLDDRQMKDDAVTLAHEAVAVLFHEPSGMFRGHANEDRYDAVDGVGLLATVLLDMDPPVHLPPR